MTRLDRILLWAGRAAASNRREPVEGIFLDDGLFKDPIEINCRKLKIWIIIYYNPSPRPRSKPDYRHQIKCLNQEYI